MTTRNASALITKLTSLVLLVGALFITSCTEEDDATPLTGSTVKDTASIGDTVAALADFSTLNAALKAAGLAETLKGSGEFTVFAPTNAAFEALPAGTLDALLADPEGQLKDILLYHVVSGKVTSDQVVSLTSAKSLEGSEITIEVKDGKVMLNGSATVTTVDIMAGNGVIHIIDAVILPPEKEEPLKTIAEIASGSEDFETLTAALSAAKLVETLNGEGEFTVFAPTDAAFDALPAGTVDALLADPEGQLKDILLYHVVSGKVTSDAVVSLTKATTVQGKDIMIEVVDGAVILNGSAKVITVDIEASNGVIHVIDAVILPPEDPKTIAEIASGSEDFETLTAALSAAKLVETLNGEGEFTVFAPTDAAFDALPAGIVDALLADPEGKLKDILLYHVVSGKVTSDAVVSLTKATTVQGKDIMIEVVDGAVIINGSAKVTTVDIEASNGVIHVIDAVILPPEDPKTIAEIASGSEDFETLTAALSAAKLVETLNGEGEFTVFAPTDAAFDALPAGTVDALLADPEGQLKDILLYHVVSGKVTSDAVVSLTKATTVQGKDIMIEVVDGAVILNGSAKVTTVDIEASNGVIHVIDAVILPPTE